GAHAALVTAVAPSAFTQAVGMLRKGGVCVMIGLPPGDFPLAIMDVVLRGLTVRGSYVGTRHDLAEALRFAGDGLVTPVIETQPFDTVNAQLDRLRRGEVAGRVVLSLQ
ncbi:MAG: zinc-binding dehydrogenase, partial [Dehalococcoidia bacterium]|nr:zinc-binding dehydrogenase [Dehalococcoidia bacterium]